MSWTRGSLLLAASSSIFSVGSVRALSTMSAFDSSLLTCQRSAYLREGNSRVLSCELLPATNTYRVLLDNSVLYPEGGGQPSDAGTVNGISVLKVAKPVDSSVLERLSEDLRATCVEVELPSAIEPETIVPCTVDWERRYDFMQQHTAQHLFSAVADKLYKADTVGWALGPDSVSVDLQSLPLLTSEQLQHIEDEVNACIRQALPVTWSVHGKDELEGVISSDESFRGMVKGAAAGLSSLRLVRIEGLDLNPCGGTHLQNLAEINCLRILGTEKDRKSLRVRFVAGHRALKYFQQAVQRESLLAQKFSAPPADHVRLLDKYLAERRDLDKQLEGAQEEIAVYLAQSMLKDIELQFDAQQASPDASQVITLHRHRFHGNLKFLLKVSSTVLEGVAALRSGGQRSALQVALYLTGGDIQLETASASSNNNSKKKKGATEAIVVTAAGSASTAPFVVSTSEPALLSEEVKAGILGSLGGAKAGGRPGLLQGQVSLQFVLAQREAVLSALKGNKIAICV